MRAKHTFPQLPDWLLAQGTGNRPAVLRKFGSDAGDLTIPFRQARRPKLITELLQACAEDAEGSPVGADLIWRMPVSWRMEALLMVAALASPQPFSWRVRCPADDCLCESEFELTPDEIVSISPMSRERETMTCSVGGHAAVLRRPTGRDQMQWLEGSDALGPELGSGLGPEEMIGSVLVEPALETLVAEGASIEAVALAVDAAMDSFDPLLGFVVSVVCPECGMAHESSPDLAGAALERLERVQYELMQDVHRLAASYHWSESEIVELPDWRRQVYLELIESGAY
jgi:hypothetical protein